MGASTEYQLWHEMDSTALMLVLSLTALLWCETSVAMVVRMTMLVTKKFDGHGHGGAQQYCALILCLPCCVRRDRLPWLRNYPAGDSGGYQWCPCQLIDTCVWASGNLLLSTHTSIRWVSGKSLQHCCIFAVTIPPVSHHWQQVPHEEESGCTPAPLLMYAMHVACGQCNHFLCSSYIYTYIKSFAIVLDCKQKE